MADTMSKPQVSVPAAITHNGECLCTDCFNNLPSAERNGRGARMIGWLSGTEQEKTCSKCGTTCYDAGHQRH